MGDRLHSEVGGRRNSHWATAARDPAAAVRTGRYAPGEQLPSLVTLAENQMHPRTMSRALRRLRELGYVDYRRGYGYFVSPPCRAPVSSPMPQS